MPNTYTYARFRFSPIQSGVLPPTGPIEGGEVEDYRVYIGQSELFCIGGHKYSDCTNGPLEGWRIDVYNSTGANVGNDTTDSFGYWEVCGLAPGLYTATETVQNGWRSPRPWQDVMLGFNDNKSVDFYNTPILCINGTKINNCTGLGLEGWTIKLTDEFGTTLPTSTDADGNYSFCGLRPGNYTISEEIEDGWMSVGPSSIDVKLECDNNESVDFKNAPLLCINGTKTDASTGKPLEGWTIKLTDESGTTTSNSTDADGNYSFCGLEPGDYIVCEELKDGWKNITPTCVPVPLDCDDEVVDFENIPASLCINGTKISNCTGEGIAGWNIKLYSEFGLEMNSTTTDANGEYSFCNLEAGNYTVCEVLQGGWKNVTARCIEVVLDTGNSEDNDFVNTPPVCITGRKINNCTGAGIEKWGIYLYDSSGKQIAATQTDRNGHYSFCGLPPGEYRVCEEIRDGYIPVTHINHSGASCLPEDCTCDVCNNCIPVILDCDNSEDNDFENIPPLAIKGKVIDDCTGLGLKGWTVKLHDGATQLTTRTTGADGSYSFTSSTTSGGLKLTAGKLYTVCEVVQDGYTPVTYHADNSSLAMSNEYCIPVFLDCGETEVEDLENIPPLLISGHEFNHCAGEGLEGWTVHLKDGAGNILETTTTDDAGYYEFSGRKPGWYTVCEDEIPEGWTSIREDPKSPAMALPGTSAAPEDCETPKCIVVRLDYCEDATDNDFENIPNLLHQGYRLQQQH